MMKYLIEGIRATILIACFGLCLGMTSSTYGGTPLTAVQTKVTQVLEVLRAEFPDKDKPNTVRREKVWTVANKMFDFKELSRRTLGKNWEQLTPVQQEEFTDLFSTHLSNVYMDRILAYSDEEVVFDRERKRRNRALVYSRVITRAKEIPINYSLIEKGGIWRVYDVVIEGVSLVSNYRSQFKEILQKDGPETLIKVLRDKVEEKA
jgi:phospholipid transport system substrate-binding protein